MSALADAERAFLEASVAVWREIDKSIDADGIYVNGVPASLEQKSALRSEELSAWRCYRDLLDTDARAHGRDGRG